MQARQQGRYATADQWTNPIDTVAKWGIVEWSHLGTTTLCQKLNWQVSHQDFVIPLHDMSLAGCTAWPCPFAYWCEKNIEQEINSLPVKKVGKVLIRAKWPIRPALTFTCVSGFRRMKWLGVFFSPRDETPNCRYPFIHLGGKTHHVKVVSYPRTQNNVPGQAAPKIGEHINH